MSENRSYLARVLDVLDLVVDAERPLTASQVAQQGRMPVSSVARLVTMLVERSLVYRNADGLLVPGAHLLHLGLRALNRTADRGQLEDLVRRVGAEVTESISAGLLVGDEIVLIARQEPVFALRVVAQVGDVVAPHTSAMGKAVLAWLPANRQLDVLATATNRSTAPRVLAGLQDELEQVRVSGFARDEETYAVGQRCRAVALRHPRYGVYGGLSIAGPAVRFSYPDAEEATSVLTAAMSSTRPEVPA